MPVMVLVLLRLQAEEKWAVTAFVRQLPTMPVERYRTLVAAYQAEHAGHANHR